MDGKLVLVNISSDKPAQAQELYASLLGMPLARSLWEGGESYHGPFSADGVMVVVNPRHHPQETVTPYFAVDNLGDGLNTLKNDHGVNIVWGPGDLSVSPKAFPDFDKAYQKEFPQSTAPTMISLGQGALLMDSEHNLIGLVQLAEYTHIFFKVGKYRANVSQQAQQHLRALQLAGKM